MKISLLRFLTTAALACAICIVHPGAAHADTIALSIDGGSVGATSGFTWGWTFTLASSVTVTQLGIYDNLPFGLGESHAVGIYEISGSTPLVSTTFASGNGATNQFSFRYQAVTPTVLAAGSYNIGAYYASTADPAFVSTTTPVTASPVTFGGGQFISGPSLANPTTVSSGNKYFGPNFQFTTVPEPSITLLVLLGGVGLMVRRRQAAHPC